MLLAELEVPAPGRPTTRDVALAVRGRGVEGLPGAVERSDHVRYQEVACRSALNRVEGMPFTWTLNPYRGCTHACHYCYARRYQTQFELGPGDDFSRVVLVKTNFPEVLAGELARPSWAREAVALGTATDPYQPIEGHYQLTRRSLAALLHGRTPVDLVTKGPMVVRDRDLLADLARLVACTVYLSVPTVDDDAWQALEPGTAPPLQRLRAARALADAGVPAAVLMMPIVPGFTTQPARLRRTLGAIADHGLRLAGTGLMRLQGGARAHFLEFLAREFPELAPRYDRLYARANPPRSYEQRVKDEVHRLAAEAGVRRGAPRACAAEAPPEAAEAQAEFSWREPDDPAVSARRAGGRSAARSAGAC